MSKSKREVRYHTMIYHNSCDTRVIRAEATPYVPPDDPHDKQLHKEPLVVVYAFADGPEVSERNRQAQCYVTTAATFRETFDQTSKTLSEAKLNKRLRSELAEARRYLAESKSRHEKDVEFNENRIKMLERRLSR